MPFVVAGEALVDIVVPRTGRTEHAPGGSPLNVAVGLARLGIETLLVTRLGADEHGRLVHEHVEASGVRLAEASVDPTGRTSTATAHLDEHGVATYDFDLTWELPPLPLPADATALHVGSIGAALRPGREAVVRLVEEAAAKGLLVSYDPNMRPVFTPDREQAWADVREVSAASRLVKMSDEDLHFLIPGGTAEDAARALLGGRTEVVVVTHGGSGAVAFSGGTRVEVPSRRSAVVDTVGAGDSFMAALLAVVAEQGLATAEELLRRQIGAAHEAAAVTVSRRGADPPRRDELPEEWARR
ncbi:MAG TPA: carbohydrate kinase [Marmoricola sp.]|nr:carbohydrate kinase [Marmoricola sp.]